jgi:hypothetical protein
LIDARRVAIARIIQKGEKEMNKLLSKRFLLVGFAAMALLPSAHADEWNQKTVLTFATAVEMPGQTLPAGMYVFKLANSHSNRHIVQVFNPDENRLFGTFLAIPSHRHHASEKTIIRFDERAAGSPQAIKAWFYPNKTYGHEFVYPKAEALALAKANNTEVPAALAEPTPSTPKPAAPRPATTTQVHQIEALLVVPLKMERPTGEEINLAQAFAPSAPLPGLPDKLPDTASPLPLIGLIGLVALGSAATLRFAVNRR